MGSREPGAYVLLVRLAEPWAGTVGRLGLVDLPAGTVAYVGSAMGGLDARVARHLRREKPLRWHIDALTASCAPLGAVAVASEARIECRLAAAMARTGWLLGPRGFGCSDCRCITHLFLGGEDRDLQGIRDRLPIGWRKRARIIVP